MSNWYALVDKKLKTVLGLLPTEPILSDNTPFPGGDIPLAAEAAIMDDHFHNYELVFGLAAAPVGTTHAADIESANPFTITAVAGGGSFGTPVLILGSSDTPTSMGSPPRQTGQTLFDLRKFWIIALSQTTIYIVRIIWGTPSQSAAQAIAAGQYTETCLQNFVGNCVFEEFFNVRVPVGNLVWAQCYNAHAVQAATATFLFSLHEYPSLSPGNLPLL